MEFADLEGQLCCIILYKKLENPWMFVFLGDPGIKLPWIWRGDHQFISVSQSCPTLCNHMNCSTPGFLVHHQFLEPTQTQTLVLMMPFNHLILYPPILLLPSIFPSIEVFFKKSVLRIRWPKNWSFSFSITPSNECADFLSDWLIGSPCSPWDSKESSPTPRSTEPDSNQLNAADP